MKKAFLEKLPADLIKNRDWGSFFYNLMRFGFCFYILFFPLGIAPREIGSILSMIGLIGYYRFSYHESNLKKIGVLKWIYLFFIAFLFFKVFHNIDIPTGWYGFRTNIHKAFILIFVGMEFVRSKRDLKLLIVLFCIAGFYEGLDGIYQYITGVDFIRGTDILGGPTGIRLTGSMKTYRVGNYISMILPVCLGAWFLLPAAWNRIQKTLFMAAMLFPATFLFIGAQTRSGFLGFFVAVIALYFLLRGFSWKIAGGTVLTVAWALFFGFKRTSLDLIMQDGRIKELWPYALEVFKSAPLLGVGINGYNPGVHSLGLSFQMHSQGIPHPHNIYIQFLCETGIIGLTILLVFLATFLLWTLRHILTGLRSSDPAIKSPWVLTALFWASFLGYTATAMSGHNFFRTWWLGLAFSLLGIVIGACLSFLRTEKGPQ